jgi:hypothetical protein
LLIGARCADPNPGAGMTRRVLKQIAHQFREIGSIESDGRGFIDRYVVVDAGSGVGST